MSGPRRRRAHAGALDNRAHATCRSGARPRRAANRTWAERLFGRWWRRQSAARQDRYATLGPLLSVLLFLAAIISAFWYLRNEEFEREQEAVRRDTEVAQQQMRLRLIENQEQLVRDRARARRPHARPRQPSSSRPRLHPRAPRDHAT